MSELQYKVGQKYDTSKSLTPHGIVTCEEVDEDGDMRTAEMNETTVFTKDELFRGEVTLVDDTPQDAAPRDNPMTVTWQDDTPQPITEPPVAGMKTIDLNGAEEWREYILPNNQVIRIEKPATIYIAESGSHRVKDEQGVVTYIPNGANIPFRWQGEVIA